jgi:hypothetical protein
MPIILILPPEDVKTAIEGVDAILKEVDRDEFISA